LSLSEAELGKLYSRNFDEAETEMDGLALRAQRGDASVLPALRQALQQNPALIDQLGGDIAGRAVYTLIGRSLDCRGNGYLGTREAILAKLESLRAELGGATSTPLERLLIERVVATWLQLAIFEAGHAQQKNPTLEVDEHLQKRIDRAHRRHLSAMKSLALVRRLLIAPRSPISIAAQLDGARPGAQRREVSVADGAAVLN
jgi:hypothetical protein